MSTENEKLNDESLVVDRPPVEERKDLKPPPNYAVVILNDDFTPMDFVVDVLMKLFSKSPQEAEKITIDVHEKGKGLAGVYTKDIAETKAYQVTMVSQSHGHPLRAEMEGLH